MFELEIVGIWKTESIYCINEPMAKWLADFKRKDEYVSAVFVHENGQYREDL